MDEVTALISSLSPDAKVGDVIDIYLSPQTETTIELLPEYICDVLGTEISENEIRKILSRLNIETEEAGPVLHCHIPAERLDLVMPQDIVEEVGRLYGYDKISPEPLLTLDHAPEINRYFYYCEHIKDFLVARGFSEVSTYTLSSTGDFELSKSASDKKFVRTNLTYGISKSLEFNLHNAPLLGLDQIKIFEIGKTFKKTGEELSLAIGIANTKTWKGSKERGAIDEIKAVRDELLAYLYAKVAIVCTVDDTGGLLMLGKKEIGMTNNVDGITEFNLGAVIETLAIPESQPQFVSADDISYQSISAYPFVLRDIAVFVPGEAGREHEVLDIIRQTAGELLVRETLFDTFTKKPKDGAEGEVKTSYAFRLVFQSSERTLTDEEINVIMQSMTDKLNFNQGFEVR
jgi:phenylalanyl-tRNA synthetase beta chain